MTKQIGINFCSKHIPMMIKTMDKHIDLSQLNEEIDLTDLFSRTTFEIITKIFFGQSITEKMEKIQYICPYTGKKSMLEFVDIYSQITVDQFNGYYNPKGKILSFLAKYDLIDPYKTNAKNTKAVYDALSKYLDDSLDEDSVYYALYSSGKFTKHECVMDTLMMLLAGSDTSSRTLSGTICLLKKNPDKLDKLMKEFEKAKITNITDIPQGEYRSIYDECDYLNYVYKEGLRLDPAGNESIPYKTVDD